jgi:hypothetical protein
METAEAPDHALPVRFLLALKASVQAFSIVPRLSGFRQLPRPSVDERNLHLLSSATTLFDFDHMNCAIDGNK